jgi:uncharacterized protein YkwD
MTRMSILCLLVPLLAACTETAPQRVAAPSPIYASLAAADTRLETAAARDLINGYRRNLGLGPLALDPVLLREAERQADAMAAGGDVARGARADIRGRLATAGLPVRQARESVSAGYLTVADAFSGWRGSPTHDATMRVPTATRMGIAARHKAGSRHHVYWSLIVSD